MSKRRDVHTVEVRRARAAIRQAMREGGECRVELPSNRKRMLAHHPAFAAPRSPLPWPLRLFQQSTLRYVVTEGGQRVSSHLYTRNRVDEAIDYFLRDLPPETRITITRI